MSSFELKANLPTETRQEIDRVEAIESEQRTTEEANFLTALSPYLTNEVLIYSEEGYIARSAGETVPTGYSGFQKGALFAKVDVATDAEVLYQNVGTVSSASWLVVEIQNGVLVLPETTTPTAVDSEGRIYTKSDNMLYFQDGAGEEKVVQTAAALLSIAKSYSFKSPSGGSGTFYDAGFYEFSSADANLTNASLTQTFGTANVAYGAHAFIVAGDAGVTDGSDLVLTVTGTSITSAGVRTASDSEVVVADCTALATNGYLETSKKWIGTVTFTLSSTGGSTYNFDFNFGYSKYEDFGNNDFTVKGFEFIGRAGANDTSFNVRLCKHSPTNGWIYHATAFVPTPTEIINLQTDYDTEYQLSSGEQFAYKRTQLTTEILGSGSEGVIIEITTGANNSIESANAHIGVVI